MFNNKRNNTVKQQRLATSIYNGLILKLRMTTSETALMYVSVPQSSPQFYRADILLGKAQSSSISMRFHKETKLDAPYNQCLKNPDDIDSDFVKAAINVRKTIIILFIWCFMELHTTPYIVGTLLKFVSKLLFASSLVRSMNRTLATIFAFLKKQQQTTAAHFLDCTLSQAKETARKLCLTYSQ